MNIISTTRQFKQIQTTQSTVLPSNCAIVPDGFDTTEFYAYNGCVDLTIVDNTVTAMTPNVEAWEAWQATLPDPAIAKAEEVRTERNALLAATDYTQVMDARLSADCIAAFKVYRQALADIPEQEGFPFDVVWPEKPETVKAAPDPVDDESEVEA